MIFTSRFLKGTNIRAITLFSIIILRDKEDKNNKVLINHEKIHAWQQAEMLWIPFFIWYGIEALIRALTKGKSYSGLSFEKECFENQDNLEYLKTRKWYSWFKYL